MRKFTGKSYDKNKLQITTHLCLFTDFESEFLQNVHKSSLHFQ